MRKAFRLPIVVRFALAISLLVPALTPSAFQPQKARNLHPEQFLPSSPELMAADYDIRRRQGDLVGQRPTDQQLVALDRLQAKVAGLEARFDPFTGAPRHLFSLSQRLTAPGPDDAVTIGREFLKANRALFRLQERDIDDLVIAKNYRTQHTGVTHLVFKQFYQGLDVFQGDIKLNIDEQGRILSINGNYFPRLSVALAAELSATDALRIAAGAIAPDLELTSRVKRSAQGVEQATIFERGLFTEDPRANLVIFPARDGGRLAWKTRLHLMDRLVWVDTLVDARTGEVLFRYNLYKFSQPQGLVFTVNPDMGPQVLKSFAGDPIASPGTWVTPLPNTATQGNNVTTLPLARNAEQQFNFLFNDIYQTDGANLFDLDGRTLRFTPNAAGGYDVNLLRLSFEDDLGRDFTSRVRPNRNSGFLFLPLRFDFPFFDGSFNTVFINADGNVTFAGGVPDGSESWADLMLDSPRIAALWDDLDLSLLPEGGGLFVRTEDDGVVITWNKVPQRFDTDSNTAQLRLFADGTIEIAFNGVATIDAVVGLSRGDGDFDLQPVDFSASDQITGLRKSLAEKFPTVELDASTTNLFYHLNVMHDYLYNLGFDEAAGNFQLDNFGRGGAGNDRLLGAAQHAGFNNAFFGTPEDGRSPFTGYFFFTDPPFRQVDSAFDADVIYHEYTHGLTNRLVGNRFDVTALSSRQGGSMGEGWSDIYSVSITNDPTTGEFVTGIPETGIRAVNYAQNALTYGQFGNRFGPVSSFGVPGGIGLDKTFFPEVHFDGEIWASTLWDLRVALGKQAFEQLVTDALKFTPSRPSYLDARDAILIADVASSGGANQTTIWSVFAARGMGLSARTDDGDDTILLQAFDTPSNPLPPGRETIFFDNMSSGENGWTVEGDDGNEGPALWHQSNRRGSTAWYYGQEESGTYDTGERNFGALTSPVIQIPAILRNGAVRLEFDHFFRGELFNTFRDNGYLRIIDRATGEMKQKALVTNNSVGLRGGEFFQREAIDISEYAGRSIQIQFYFDTLNALRNTAEGWFIDNVRVSRRLR